MIHKLLDEYYFEGLEEMIREASLLYPNNYAKIRFLNDDRILSLQVRDLLVNETDLEYPTYEIGYPPELEELTLWVMSTLDQLAKSYQQEIDYLIRSKDISYDVWITSKEIIETRDIRKKHDYLVTLKGLP